MSTYLKITTKELQALIETADSCRAMANDESSAVEAKRVEKAYNSVLNRNNLKLEERRAPNIKI